MAYSYHALERFNDWLTHHPFGSRVLDAEENILSSQIKSQFGKHCLLVGVPAQSRLLNLVACANQTIISPLPCVEKKNSLIEADFNLLPVLSGSIDLVLLCHTLELVDNPRALLNEACRIVKPEGLIVIIGFNPSGLWRLLKLAPHPKKLDNSVLWHNQIKQWLRLADFQLEDQKKFLFRPPISNTSLYNKLIFLERIGNVCFPFLANEYMITARAKVIPLSPIRTSWKQQLNNLKIKGSIFGNLAGSVLNQPVSKKC